MHPKYESVPILSLSLTAAAMFCAGVAVVEGHYTTAMWQAIAVVGWWLFRGEHLKVRYSRVNLQVMCERNPDFRKAYTESDNQLAKEEI
jgi:hypothetical protein